MRCMTFERILCPVDFSPGSQRAMRLAARLASEAAGEPELVLAHVCHVPPPVYAADPAFLTDALQARIEDERCGLAAAVAEASRSGVRRVTTRFLTGTPWAELVALLRDDARFGLVVLGSDGRTGPDGVAMGSVAEKMVWRAPCPVLTVPGRGPISALRHVLCPVDFSEGSRRAVALAAELVRGGGAGITLLHSFEAPAGDSGGPRVAGCAEALDGRGVDRLEAWARDLGTRVSVPVTVRSRTGRPGAQILAALDDDRTFDLVVIGGDGRTGPRGALLGSVAEEVVHYARCPVVVARAPRRTISFRSSSTHSTTLPAAPIAIASAGGIGTV